MRSFLVAALLLCSLDAWAQRVQLDISGANFKPLPMAFPPLMASGDKAVAYDVDEALQNDLKITGIFDLLDRKGFLAADKEGLTATSINFSHWLDVAAEELLKGMVTSDGKQSKAEFHLFNVSSGREELKLNFSAPQGDARRLAHQAADALFKFFTHEPGAFESQIIYVKKNGQNKDVAVADWDGRHERLLTHGGLNLLPSWSPDGHTVAFTSYKGGNPDLYLYDLRTDQMTPLVRRGNLTTGAAFSPDGRKIAFSMSEGEGSQIYMVDADGSNLHKISGDDFSISSSPSWSPDGKQLAFVSNRGGSPQIYVMPASAQGAATRLTWQGNYNQTPQWSPRGDILGFTARDERNVFDVFTITVDGSAKVVRITQDQGNNEQPTFAPNGRLMAFTSTRGGGSDLFVTTIDGNSQHQLTKGENITTPSWGPLPKQ
jgi:TolB protein